MVELSPLSPLQRLEMQVHENLSVVMFRVGSGGDGVSGLSAATESHSAAERWRSRMIEPMTDCTSLPR